MDTPKWAKGLFIAALLIAATIGVVWLAGFLFLTFSKVNAFGKTDFSTWWTYWQAYKGDPVLAKRLMSAALVAAVAAYGGPAVLAILALRTERDLHGAARFAKTPEIAKAGLLGSTGVIVGKWGNRFLMFAGMQFVMLAAPTRSGKGVGIVIPNLLNWPDSVVALDVKLENFLITSKFRKHCGQEVYLFNPFCLAEGAEGDPMNGKTHRYNPLGYISDNPHMRVTDIMAIGYSLYPGDGREPFFDDAARNLFLGLVLYLCETPALPRTIGELLRQSSGNGQPVKAYLQNIINERNYREIEETDDKGKLVKVLVPVTDWDGQGLPPLSNECVDALNRFTTTSDNTLSSIMATFNVPLTIWASPIVDAATSGNDFDLRDVRKKRLSIYIGIPANKLAEAKLLINLFYTQLVSLNTNQLLHATPELKYQCLMLNDEFTAPGRIGIIDKANSYMAGYGLRLLTIVQSPGQLEAEPPKGYGRENARTLITNHACQLFYTPRVQSDANEYSEALGYLTVHSKNKSNGKGGTSMSETIGEGAGQRRALMLPQELKEMSQREQIVNLENTKPIKCKKIAYYAERVFMNRLKAVSPTLAKLKNKLPTQKQLEAVWGSGELAAPVPSLDLDLHQAVVQKRIRPMTVADVKEGKIDLRKLALNTSALALTASNDGVEPGEVANVVESFFDALDASNNYEAQEETQDVDEDGIGERPSDDELLALDAGVESDNSSPTSTPDAVISNAVIDLTVLKQGARQNIVLPAPASPSNDELTAMMDAVNPDDDTMPDDANMISAIDAIMEEEEPATSFMNEQVQPIDLSLLDKPLRASDNTRRHKFGS